MVLSFFFLMVDPYTFCGALTTIRIRQNKFDKRPANILVCFSSICSLIERDNLEVGKRDLNK